MQLTHHLLNWLSEVISSATSLKGNACYLKKAGTM